MGKVKTFSSLVVAALGIKAMTYIADNYVKNIDPSGSFSSVISGFLGIADMIFYGLIALIILLIPYYLSKRKGDKKNVIPDRAGPVGRK
jgi:uncharacterized membrane protein